MTDKHIERWQYPLLMIVLAVGFGLRVWGLGSASLRGDEAFSASYWSGIPLAQSLASIATIEPHPPLTYAAFRAWGLLVGINSELVLRMLPALGGLLGVALIYTLAKAMFNPTVGLLAAVLLALTPHEIWHARDFRNYALWSAFNLFTMYVGWRAIKFPRWRALLAYGIAALSASLVFYFELLFMGAVGLYGLVKLKGGWRWRWLVIHAAIGSVVVGVFMLLQGSLFSRGGYAGNIAYFDLSTLILTFPGALLIGDLAPSELLLIASALAWAGAALSLIALRSQLDQRLWLVCLLAVPIFGLSVISSVVAVFLPRYVLPAVAPLLILLAGGWYYGWHRDGVLRLLVAGSLIAVMSLFMVSSVQLHVTGDFGKSPNWKVIRDFLMTHAAPDDLVVQTTVDAAFGYYVDPVMHTAAIPASPQQTETHIAQQMSELDAQFFTIWLFEHSFYDWPNARAARRWLEANRVNVSEHRVMGAPLARYLPRSVTTAELPEPSNIDTSTTAKLRGVRVLVQVDTVEVWLYWSDAVDASLAASVQLIGDWNPISSSPVWAQSDLYLEPTSALQRTVHILPLETVAAGDYTLIAKLYNPVTGKVFTIDGEELYSLDTLLRE
ncbi:glycosyltransferase family 39 protein [Aggregatilineales bacterium SYSU G02658]